MQALIRRKFYAFFFFFFLKYYRGFISDDSCLSVCISKGVYKKEFMETDRRLGYSEILFGVYKKSDTIAEKQRNSYHGLAKAIVYKNKKGKKMRLAFSLDFIWVVIFEYCRGYAKFDGVFDCRF